MTVLEQLKKTREILVERGRCEGDLIEEETCKVCLLGAVGLAVVGEAFEEDQSYHYFGDPEGDDFGDSPGVGVAYGVVEAIRKHIPANGPYGDYSDVYRFNDHASGDAEVFDLIDRAIADQEAQQ